MGKYSYDSNQMAELLKEAQEEQQAKCEKKKLGKDQGEDLDETNPGLQEKNYQMIEKMKNAFRNVFQA